jgi:elongation factor 3
MLESLSLGDEPKLVSSVKADGVEKSGLAASIDVLKAKCASKTEEEALAGLALAKSLSEGAKEAEPFTKECLSAALRQAASKSAAVRKAAVVTSSAICENITPFAMKSLLPSIFKELPVENKWQIRELALKCLSVLTKVAPQQMGNALPEVVPEVTACMWDTKKQVKASATAAMKSVCDVIGNKDIEHMTDKIVVAITKPKEVPEIMHEMAGVTFVQSVESPALAMVVPLLLRGLREKSTATKRQSAVIINNMSKLVDNPLDAAPFLPLLLPALETNASSISDPEARGVTEKAVEQMNRLKGLAEKAVNVRGDTSKLASEIEKALAVADATPTFKTVVDHAAVIATCMMDLGFMVDLQWKKNIAGLFKDFIALDKAEASIEVVRVEAEKNDGNP